MVKYLPAVGCLLVAIVLAFGATRTSRFECGATTCTRDGRTFPITDVREVRFVGDYGKHKDQGEVQLIFANGTQMTLVRTSEDGARERQAQLQQFFASPSGSLVIESKPNPWMLALGLGLGLAGVVIGVRAYRKPTVRSTSARARVDKKRIVIAAAIGAALVIGVQLAFMLHARTTQGTLELTCEQRCRFQGTECLPGGKLSLSVDPGTHTIEVWARSGEALWMPQPIEIEVGETTEFTCR